MTVFGNVLREERRDLKPLIEAGFIAYQNLERQGVTAQGVTAQRQSRDHYVSRPLGYMNEP